MSYNDMWLSHNDNDDIEVRDDDMPLKISYIIKKEDLDPKMYVIDFGKWAGNNLSQINIEDPAYIDWLKNNSNDFFLQQCIINL